MYSEQEHDSYKKKTEQREVQEPVLLNKANTGFVLVQLVHTQGLVTDLLVLATNAEFEKISGQTAKKSIGKPFSEVLPDQLKNQVDWTDICAQLIVTGESSQFELEANFLAHSFTVSAFPAGENSCALTFLAKKLPQTQEGDLVESTQFLRSTLNGLSAHIAVVNDSGEIVLTNKAYRDFADQNGIESVLVSEKVNYLAVCDAVQGQEAADAHTFAQGLKEVLAGKRSSFELEYPCHSPNEKRWFIAHVTPFISEGPRLAVVAHENITARKLAELNLERTKSELWINSQMSRVGGWSLDIATEQLEWSEVTREIHEVAPDFKPDLQTAIFFYKAGESRQKITEAATLCIESGVPYEMDTQIITAKGKEIWVRTMGSAEFENGKCVRILGTFQDINERKLAEENLRLQAKRSEALLALPKLSEDYEEKVFMQRAMELVEDLTGSKISFIHLINDGGEEIELVAWSRRTLEHYCTAAYDSHYPVNKAGIWADALREGKPVIFNDYPSYPHKKGLPEGHSHLQRLISVPVIENGQVVLLAGIGNKETDYTAYDSESTQLMANSIWQIVKEDRSAKAAKEAADRIDHLARHVPGALYQFQLWPDGSSAVPYASMGIRDIYGVLPEQITGNATDVFSSVHPEDLAELNNSIQKSAQTLSVWRNQHRVNLPDGRMIWVEGEASPEAKADGSIIWHGYIRDITEQKQADEVKKARQERAIKQRNLIAQLTFDNSIVNGSLEDALKIIVTNLTEALQVDWVSVWLFSGDGLTINRQILFDKISGLSTQNDVLFTAQIHNYIEALKKDSLVDADDAINDTRTTEVLGDYIRQHKISSMLDSAIHQDGQLIGILSATTRGPIRKWSTDEKSFLSAISNLVSQLYTNSERKKALDQLRLLDRAVEASSVSVVITDVNGTILYVNPYFLKNTGYTLEEVIGNNPRVLSSGKQSKTFYQELWGTIKSGKEWFGEFQNLKKNGELYWEKAQISPITNTETGQITHFVAIKEDITEKKKTLDQLVSTLQDKEHLVQELSHRSYNNMQVILAYIEYTLALHPELTTDQFAADINGQIQAMVLAHRQLNKGNHLSRIDLAEYLKTLALSIVARSPQKGKIKMSFDLTSIQLLIDAALPVGTIITELLTNCIKYAFPDPLKTNSPSEIRLSSSITSADLIEICIQDNGINWGEDTANTTFIEEKNELAIVMINQQLGGSFSIERANGTTLRITFQDNRYTERV